MIMSPGNEVHHNLLFETDDSFRAAMEILNTPIVTMGERRGLLRRRTRSEVILAGTVGHAPGHGKYAGRHVIWTIERTEADVATWAMVREMLSPLEPRYTEDSGVAWKFLGRS